MSQQLNPQYYFWHLTKLEHLRVTAGFQMEILDFELPHRKLEKMFEHMKYLKFVDIEVFDDPYDDRKGALHRYFRDLSRPPLVFKPELPNSSAWLDMKRGRERDLGWFDAMNQGGWGVM
jgi:hypothetical protein